MAIKESIKSGVDFTVDTVSELASIIAEKNRIRGQLNHIKKLIKTDSATRDQAYIELGRFFYENLRENASSENEAICAVIDAASERISAASLKYMELLNQQNEMKLRTENTEKLKKIVSEKAAGTAKAAKEKGAELSKKAKDLAAQGVEKAKDFADGIKTKADDTVDDITEKFDPEGDAEVEQIIAEEQAKVEAPVEEATSELEEMIAAEQAKIQEAQEEAPAAPAAEESPESFDF